MQQRVAVVGRVRHEIGGDVAAGAAAVLDDELLAQPLGERLREHARGDVARGARTEADDDAHRPRRIALRLGEPNGKRGSAGCELEKSTACKSHGVRSLKSGRPDGTPQFRQSMPTGKSYCVLHAKQAAGNAKIYTGSKSERWPLGGQLTLCKFRPLLFEVFCPTPGHPCRCGQRARAIGRA